MLWTIIIRIPCGCERLAVHTILHSVTSDPNHGNGKDEWSGYNVRLNAAVTRKEFEDVTCRSR